MGRGILCAVLSVGILLVGFPTASYAGGGQPLDENEMDHYAQAQADAAEDGILEERGKGNNGARDLAIGIAGVVLFAVLGVAIYAAL